MEYIQDSLFGKMSPERSAAIKEKISALSAKSSSKSSSREPLCLRFLKTDGPMQTVIAVTDGASLTEFSMLNTGESPSEIDIQEICSSVAPHSVAEESTLSSILEANVPEKYYLSPKACEGILRRAESRGKELKPILKEALIQQAAQAQNR